MELADHVNRERATPVEHFGHSGTTPDEWFEIPAIQPATLHVVQQRVDGIRRFDWFLLRFVVIDQRRQDIEPVSGGCARPGVHEAFNLLERLAVISPGLDWTNLHENLTPWRRQFDRMPCGSQRI